MSKNQKSTSVWPGLDPYKFAITNLLSDAKIEKILFIAGNF